MKKTKKAVCARDPQASVRHGDTRILEVEHPDTPEEHALIVHASVLHVVLGIEHHGHDFLLEQLGVRLEPSTFMPL